LEVPFVALTATATEKYVPRVFVWTDVIIYWSSFPVSSIRMCLENENLHAFSLTFSVGFI
jgi:hypothetical protein